jgi:hypothetical protein
MLALLVLSSGGAGARRNPWQVAGVRFIPSGVDISTAARLAKIHRPAQAKRRAVYRRCFA